MADTYIPPDVPLYLTPDEFPSGVFCRTFGVPNNPTWNALLDGALTPLMEADAWREFGELTPQECADIWRSMMSESWAGVPECETVVQTPFWDDKNDVDDTATPATQTWYGRMSDPDAPPGELDFIEDASVWIVSGMVALATGSVGVAIAFRTFVRNFILIQKRGDVGETIRYVIDGRDMTTITGDGSGDLAEVNMIGDPDLSEHQFYIIKTG